MGDMSAEPSMEEILSSIKRIIAEEEAPTGRRRVARQPAPSPSPVDDSSADAVGDEEVLELSDPMPAYPQTIPVQATAPATMAEPPEETTAGPMPAPTFPEARDVATPPAAPAKVAADPIVSPAAVDATRDALDSLSRLLVKPDPQSDGTLEGLVREMLRPMLKEWLDAHLPDMVEKMVSREIARISGQTR
jgi:hypothetical protein